MAEQKSFCALVCLVIGVEWHAHLDWTAARLFLYL